MSQYRRETCENLDEGRKTQGFQGFGTRKSPRNYWLARPVSPRITQGYSGREAQQLRNSVEEFGVPEVRRQIEQKHNRTGHAMERHL
jgi:hypothetical protein